MRTAFTSTSSFGHRFDLTIYKHRMSLHFLITGISAFVPFPSLKDSGMGKENLKMPINSISTPYDPHSPIQGNLCSDC